MSLSGFVRCVNVSSLIGIALGLATFSLGPAVSGDLRFGDWFGFVDYDHGSDTAMHRGASTEELWGRAAPLLLEGCSERVDVSESVGPADENQESSSRALSYLHLNFLPDDGFDADTESLAPGGTTLWWLHFPNDTTAMSGIYPVLFDPGMDGYYFSFEVSSGSLLFDNTSLQICRTRDATAQSCREFSLRGIVDGIRFVCRKEITR